MLAGDETGSPAVEFALVFPIFIALVLATLQAGTIFLVKAFFESSAEEAARVVLTNQTDSSTFTAAQFQTEICNQLTALFNCSEVTVELEPLPAGATNLASLLPTELSWARRASTLAPTALSRAPTCCWS
jgi:Flp pilus assembly protein TadG